MSDRNNEPQVPASRTTGTSQSFTPTSVTEHQLWGRQTVSSDMSQADIETQEEYLEHLEENMESLIKELREEELAHLVNQAFNAYTELPRTFRSSYEIRGSLQHLPEAEIERIMSAERARRSRVRRQRRYQWLEHLTPRITIWTERTINIFRDRQEAGDVIFPSLCPGATNRLTGISPASFNLHHPLE